MARIIPILKDITEANNQIAAGLRERFRQNKALVLDIIASPGAGKTSLLERTIERLKDELRIVVIEGDPTSTLDADRVEAAGVSAVQINTDGGCHLEAAMIRSALGPDGLEVDGADIIIIENVGNLLCPTGWDLGEDAKVVVASLPEGDDKPLKYPMAFLTAQAVVINKIDLEPYVPARAAKLRANALAVNPGLTVFEVSCLTGQGLDAWLDWVRQKLAAKRAA
ncbi:MAG: hydrogenase nickel incorporation protein HypB [Anaerolineae bacterium]|nr:hydrogenase nickel incorporation protein HypB [Anaerolineae bacterium]